MLPLLLEIENFQSHKKSVLDFTRLDRVTLVVGEYEDKETKSNGAGKTTIFDAISWVLFDRSRVSGTKSLTIDELVRDGADHMMVRYTFIARDSNTYRIQKKYKKRKRYHSPVDIEIELKDGEKWKSIAKDGNRETKSKIIEIVGYDDVIWEKTALCKQHEVAGIASEDSTKRLALIKKLLRLDKWNDYAEEANQRAKELKKKISEHEESLKNLREARDSKKRYEESKTQEVAKAKIQEQKLEIQKKKVEKLRAEIDEVNKTLGALEQLKETVEQLDERCSTLLKESKQIEEQKVSITKKISSQKKEYQEKTKRLREIDNIKPDKIVLINEYREVSKEKDKLQKELGALEGMFTSTMEQGRELRKEADSFKELGLGSCPTCKNEIKEEHAKGVNQEYEKRLGQLRKKAKDLKKEKEVVEKELKKREDKADLLLKKQEYFNKLIEEKNAIVERLKAVTELVEARQTSEANYAAQIKINKDQLRTIQNQKEQAQKKLSAIGGIEAVKRHKGLIEQLKHENEILEEIRQELAELKSSINIHTTKIEELKIQIEKAKKLEKELEPIRKKIALYNTLEQDFKKLIPTMILENSASMIEAEVNRCLTTLSDGFNVGINTQHQNKTNDNIKEVFDIQVTAGDRTRAFELLSGGEQFRVAFAIRVALSIIHAQETGINIGAIFYDEPFNDLDEDGLDKIQEIFVYLSSLFEYQLAITHQSRLKEMFNDVICVKKTREGSHIEQ